VLAFPNAKVNLGLRILSRRLDGYHNLSSCLYPIPWFDILEIVKSEQFEFRQTGLTIDGSPDANLVIKAYEILKDQFDLSPVKIHLHKVIPMGAGLGGGSSDAAFTLKILTRIFELPVNSEALKEMAAKLGSDCPFFIDNRPAVVSETGTVMDPIALDLSDFFIVAAHPGIHVSTKEAYNSIIPSEDVDPIRPLLERQPGSWQNLFNDFEKSVFPIHPKIEQMKNHLLEQGALYASMSGSGSAVFGLFEKEPKADLLMGHSGIISRLKL
jgi:4-diphosphocytidyl-2-C-methyl-D-erythritol kinase